MTEGDGATQSTMNIRNIAALAALAALPGAALAQTNGPTGFSARLGYFFTTNNGSFDGGFGAGIDYKLNNFSVRAPGEGLQSYLGVSLDYYGGDGASNIPLALTYNVRSGDIVYSAGVGVNFYNIDDVDETGTSLGGQVGIAYEFGNAGRMDKPLFVSAKYFLTRKSDLGGFGVYVGYRF